MAKGKHRATRPPIVWKWEINYIRNRWHYFQKPKLIRFMKGITKWDF